MANIQPTSDTSGTGLHPASNAGSAMAEWRICYVLITGGIEYPREITIPAKSQNAAKAELDRLIIKTDIDDYKIRSCAKVFTPKNKKRRP